MSASADAWAKVRAEHAAMAKLIAATKADSARIDARLAELNAASAKAWKRHSAFRGQLTRAEKTGDEAKITFARARERHAHAEADAAANAYLEEAHGLLREGNAGLTALFDQNDRVHAAETAWYQTWGAGPPPTTGRTPR